jgi:hypothetical protein
MRIGLVAMLVLVLAACGSQTDENAAKRTAGNSVKTQGSDEVAAVLESAGAPVAKVQFVIESLPVVGKPFNVKVVVSSATPVPQLRLSVTSAGFTIEPPTVLLVLADAGNGGGNINTQTFSVTAQQEGLSELAVHLATDADAPETLYKIPLLVTKPAA